MIAKRKRGSKHPTDTLASSKSGGGETDHAFVVGPIGLRGQQTLEEWKALRDSVFDELRKFPIPKNLVDAVDSFRPHASVTWRNDKGAPVGPADVLVKPVVEDQPRKSPEEMEQFLSNVEIKFDELSNESLPKTAGDALAWCLQGQLALLNAEAAPVRVKKMLAPSVIAGIAIDILETCALRAQPPGQELIDLFRALLKVDKRPLKSSREFSARDSAAWILAQKPNASTRELARILDVQPSSVSRWRKKDPSFGKMVESKKQSIQYLTDRGLWPPPQASRGTRCRAKSNSRYAQRTKEDSERTG